MPFIAMPGIHNRSGLKSVLTAMALAAALPASAEVTFDFEPTSQNYRQSPMISGDFFNFAETTEQARSGEHSLKFVDPSPEAYESFTYDIPFDEFTSGIIRMSFYDNRGSVHTGHNFFAGGSIIVEDADNPQDFVALEILSVMYPMPGFNPAYYGTEGSVDRLAESKFDSTLPARSVGHHTVEFHVSAEQTLLYVDGKQATKVAGPGSASTLRIRVMADSPSGAGSGNWVTEPRAIDESWYDGEDWIYYDSLEIVRELPTPDTHTNGFEIVNVGGTPTPEYDALGDPGSPFDPDDDILPYDNPYMNGFLEGFGITTNPTYVESGSQAIYFTNPIPAQRSLVFDMSEAQHETTATIHFYDALGTDIGFDKSNAIIVENAADPGDFIALLINNWPYPGAGPSYYLARSTGQFYSGVFPVRSIGWHKLEIGFYDDYTLLAVDDVLGVNKSVPAAPVHGPGNGNGNSVNIRIMADDPTVGGFSNYTTTDPFGLLYQVSTDPYVYYDDITLPVPADASVTGWHLY